jgi:3-isopropylmalate dehydratase small subunit
MRAFSTLHGLVAPLDRANVDTDAILPKQYLKSIRRSGYGPYLFDEWRYLSHGEPGQDCRSRPLNPHFVLNDLRYQGAEVLLARENFGCGSSREHAVWALEGYGIRALVAPSFADIFHRNCLKNGLLPVILEATTVDLLFAAIQSSPGYRLQIDLSAQIITGPNVGSIGFGIGAYYKDCLLRGLDDIELTLLHSAEIQAYETQRREDEPWIFP